MSNLKAILLKNVIYIKFAMDMDMSYCWQSPEESACWESKFRTEIFHISFEIVVVIITLQSQR